MKPEPFEDLVPSFRRDLRAADKAERTIAIYSDSLRFFRAWLAAEGLPDDSGSLTKANISGWLASLVAKGNATNTVANRFRGIRRFTRWAMTEGVVEGDPMAGLERPVPASHPVPLLTDEQIAALLKVTTGTDFAERRDHAIIRVFMDCGLRLSEVAGLRVEDVDLKNHDVLHVIGKGRKARAVPFAAKTGQALQRYLRERRSHRYAAAEGLWLGERGPYGVWGVEERLKVRAAQAGLSNLHAHQFRHTFAHDWLVNGGQERDLMRLAGWSSDAMLQVYAASAADERAHAAARRMRRGDRV